LPKDVLIEAEKVAHHLTERWTWEDENSESSKVAKRRKAVLKVALRPFCAPIEINPFAPAANNVDAGL